MRLKEVLMESFKTNIFSQQPTPNIA